MSSYRLTTLVLLMACSSEGDGTPADLSDDMDALSARVEALEAELAQAQTEADARDGRLDQADSDRTALQTQLDQTDSTLTALQTDVGELETASQARTDALQTTVDAHTEDLTALQAAQSGLDASVAANTAGLSDLTASQSTTTARVTALEAIDADNRLTLTELTLASLDTVVSRLEADGVTGLTITTTVENVNHTSGTTRSYANICCPVGKRVLGLTQYGRDASGFVTYPMENRLDYASGSRCWNRFIYGNFGGGPVTRLHNTLYCVDE